MTAFYPAVHHTYSVININTIHAGKKPGDQIYMLLFTASLLLTKNLSQPEKVRLRKIQQNLF